MKIITHNGQFHADEIFGIALIRAIYDITNIEVVRTRNITTEWLQDPNTWVLDVGSQYNPQLKNFDHHQDLNLESTNVLLLEYFYQNNEIPESLYKRLYEPFKEISLIDRNGYNTQAFHVNSLIKSFNSLTSKEEPNRGFYLSIDVAFNFINSKIVDVLVEKESRIIFEESKRIAEHTVLCYMFPVFWKSYKECLFLISKEEEKDHIRWVLNSIDGKKYPILPTGKEDFIHPGNFLASYFTKEDAIESGIKQSKQYVKL